jgi:hypothetical protein
MSDFESVGQAEGDVPMDPEPLVATLAQMAATRGDALAVAALAESEPAILYKESYRDFGKDYDLYTLRLRLPAALYARLGDDLEKLRDRLREMAYEITSAYDELRYVAAVVIAPEMERMDGWREQAKSWLRGEGINNQGRVRSDNIAARQHDGLLFRSQPEINLYSALKSKGIYFAPLPVFLRGGATYQRLEPDFVLLHKGVMMVVEVDGATVHQESPAEAHARTQGLLREGVRVERVPADACETPEKAAQCATRLIEALERYREL